MVDAGLGSLGERVGRLSGVFDGAEPRGWQESCFLSFSLLGLKMAVSFDDMAMADSRRMGGRC